MAITVGTDLADSQIEVYDQAVHIFGKNIVSLDGDGSVTFGGSIWGKDNVFHIYTRLAAATTPLTDGTEVTPVTMVDSKVVITPVEYGTVVAPTRYANSTTAGKADLAAAQLVAVNMIETMNQLGVNALEAATNSTAAATPGTLAKGDLRAAYEQLASAGALKFPDGRYRLRLHPKQITDLKDDYEGIVKYTSADLALNGEVGRLEGFTIIEDRAVTDGVGICYAVNALGMSESIALDTRITAGTDNLGRIMNYGYYTVREYGIVDQNSAQLITGS